MNNNTQPEKLGFFALIGRTFATAGVALNTVNTSIQAIDTTVTSVATINENILRVAVDKSADFRSEMAMESSISRAKLQVDVAKADKEVAEILATLNA